MPPPLTVTFTAGTAGPWRIERVSAVLGESLAPAASLAIAEGLVAAEAGEWSLRGVVSHPRYATSTELRQLAAVQPTLGRPEASCAALIPIRKSEAWWTMGQDERRAIFEEGSRHIARSMRHLPAVARRLNTRFPRGLEPGRASKHERSLTSRETEVLQLISDGFSNKEIGVELGIRTARASARPGSQWRPGRALAR
jgi:ATP/maltotriose-dependent transcriptional regulator MalT